jgi:hypothetical protein
MTGLNSKVKTNKLTLRQDSKQNWSPVGCTEGRLDVGR